MSTLDFRDLPEDRLSTTDKDGGRLWIIPAHVKGYWKKRKTIFHVFLLCFFVLTPWLRYKGSPLVLFDIFNRQFIIMGRVFSSHDAPLLFFILGLLGFGLILATALWGRIWCGWACPQTVFIEQVFRRIETWVMGHRPAQIACYKNSLEFKNLTKIILKWILFVMVSVFLAHTFIAYFVSWEKLLMMMSHPPQESWTVFLFVFIFSALILFDFAWFREQFCIIMCPYGRFQAVLMDQNSKTIVYDSARGEPRTKGIKKEGSSAGDCVDCYKCVSVCPTGIDIRRGQQLECIACTACIDACDEVMEKVKRPKGLIRYATLNEIEGKEQKKSDHRVIAYLAVLIFMAIGLIYGLLSYESLYYSILRQNQKTDSVIDGILLNNFKIHLKNPELKPLEYEILLKSTKASMAPETLKGVIEPNESIHRPFFIKIENWENKSLGPVEIVLKYKKENHWIEIVDQVQIISPKK